MSDEGLSLPRVSDAEVPKEKLRDYALNAEHPVGRHKARVFKSTLGIGHEDWSYLSGQILERLEGAPVTAIRPKPPHGLEYEVRLPIDGLNGETHTIVTGWLVREGQPPRLLTTYVETPKRP
jgi:hypothetical protein